MHETPAEFNDLLTERRSRYPADNLSGFRYHTGAALRPLQPEEPCPVLFRDLGPVALGRFLRGELRRLAGPPSPIIYLRPAEYVEPYTDHERIGRLIFLRPLRLHPWHSGVPLVYVAHARHLVESAPIGFVPGDVPLEEAARLAKGLGDVRQLRDVFGERWYDEAVAETRSRLEILAAELAQTEEWAAPLRCGLQAADPVVREQMRATMERIGLTENDLCAAWHHLPRERRGWIQDALQQAASGRSSP